MKKGKIRRFWRREKEWADSFWEKESFFWRSLGKKMEGSVNDRRVEFWWIWWEYELCS
jgi:hypothetical protein